eukprot:COSAG02_NODE_28642_length_585_cov_1.578189_1_plen_32_part_10
MKIDLFVVNYHRLLPHRIFTIVIMTLRSRAGR